MPVITIKSKVCVTCMPRAPPKFRTNIRLLLQVKSPRDMKTAIARLRPHDSDNPLVFHRDHLHQFGVPNVLFIGSSHVSRLKKFVNNRNTPLIIRNLMANTYQMGVGGVKWWSLSQNLRGEELEDKKKHLGNQWDAFHADDFHPHFVTLWIGSNDCDDLDLVTK